MKHHVHPHGDKVVHLHKLHDHLFPKSKHVLPDADREHWMEEHPYPNDMNPYPTEHPGPAHNERTEPNFHGKKE